MADKVICDHAGKFTHCDSGGIVCPHMIGHEKMWHGIEENLSWCTCVAQCCDDEMNDVTVRCVPVGG